jgi:hypothetical protein
MEKPDGHAAGKILKPPPANTIPASVQRQERNRSLQVAADWPGSAVVPGGHDLVRVRSHRPRLRADEVAKLLNCSTDDVAILVSAGKLRALGRPKPNAVKFFNAIELIVQLADPCWLDEATKTIGQYWRHKNVRRNGSEQF